MAGLGVKLFTDEMISPDLAVALRSQGYDTVSCQEVSRSGLRIPDNQQLAYATQNGRAILTFNARDFLQLDRQWKERDRRHAGIVVAPQLTELGELLRRVKRYLDQTEPSAQHNALLWLGAIPRPEL